MGPDLTNLLDDCTKMEIALYWLGFLIERELAQAARLPTRAHPPQYALAA